MSRNGDPGRKSGLVDSAACLFTRVDLDEHHFALCGELPVPLSGTLGEQFGELWDLHPPTQRQITIHGREVAAPRWDQAYGRNYVYSGQVNVAAPVPDILQPLFSWVQSAINPHLNGVLVNWYDASLGHYIGPHRDSTRNMVENAPIVTVSLGEERVFRMRPVTGRGYRDFSVAHGSVVMIPYATNQRWKHEIPRFKRFSGKRISITFRAFVD